MKKQHKQYSRPKKKWDKKRIEDENVLIEKYGLKNKKELWRTTSYVDDVIRKQAKKMLLASQEQQNTFLEKLYNMGLISKDAKLDDVLALSNINILERRLQTILVKKKLANTPKQARQMITHKRIVVSGNVVNVPSFIISRDAENEISIKMKKPKEKTNLGEAAEQPVEKTAEKPAESIESG